MTIITDERCTGYSSPGHPERPARVADTLAMLRAQDVLPLTWATPGTAAETEILRVHTPQMVARLQTPRDFDADTPYHDGIEVHAQRSVAAALEALSRARQGELAFSLMRPPGHHASRGESMGFCYLNNIAIAVCAALAAGTKRIAVFDFDVHHGNGTEDVLLGRPGAAFFSVHQHPAYPGTGAAHVGGNCFNYPVRPDTPRGEYRATLARALDDLKSFQPGLVAVSAGFDAYVRDPLADGTLELEDFHWLGKSIRALAVPAFSVLEGGYSSRLPELILAYLRGLAGK